ncbi:MAG: sirohydrochlorin chelatase [Actinomycetota bacterium]|nr:sirohydrochlorin chelatase [Actinomycetota bacterium]
MSDAVLLVAHGSRRGSGQEEMWALRDLVAAALPGVDVDLGYLELSDPPAGPVIDGLVRRGATRIAAVPLMLHAAGHSKSDVPAVVLEARVRHAGCEIRYGRPLGIDHALLDLARRRIADAGGTGLPLALLSRGTSDPEANGDASKAARMVADINGSRAFSVGFSGVTWPTVPEALKQVAAGADGAIAAFAWFLATGVLIERMRGDFNDLTEETGIKVVDAGYFGPCAEVADLVVARATEALRVPVAMNCDACAYRRPFPGHEDRVGQALGVGHSHLAEDHRHEGHRHHH